MNKYSKTQPAKASLFRLSPIAGGAAVMLMAMGSAHGQTSTQPAATDASQTVTVTGIRRGIEGAISVKKNATSIVEAVSAEDIGKLPDVSIAESIARLPGLSAQRVGGRAQVISVRGLSPDFATTLLNGRELVSTGDNRSVEFDQYPSELLSGVTVFKTPEAALVGQGLSGTLDMQTVRPLNFASRVISVNGRLSKNSLGAAANADANGNRFSASYIDQFANRTLGIAIGFAHQDTPIQENQVGIYEPWKILPGNVSVGLPANTFATEGIKALRRTGYAKRDGVMATVEWRPSKDWTSVLDIFHSKAEQEDTANQLEMNLVYNGSYPCTPTCVFSNTTRNANGTITGTTLTNVYPLVRGMYNAREDKIDVIGWNNKFKLGPVAVVADVNHSKATRDEISLENNTQLTPSPRLDTATLKFNSNDFSQIGLTNNYNDPTNLKLRGTIYGSGYGKVPKVEDELTGFRLTGSMAAPAAVSSLLSDIEFGLNYADRAKKKRQPEGGINVKASVVGGETPIAADLQYGPVSLGFAGLGNIASWNVPGAVGRYMDFAPSSTAAAYLVAKSWDVSEETTTTFLKGNIDADWGGINVRGNVGVQVQNTKQSSEAVRLVNGGNPALVNIGKSDTDVLPSVNLAFGLAGDQTVRVALAKQVARPRVDQMRASLEVGVSDAPDSTGKRTISGGGGNPKLDPWKATAFDISYEKYFGTKAYVAAAYFYKNLDSYIYTKQIDNFDFSQYVAGIPENPLYPGVGIATTGKYSAPTNGTGGKLSGVELTASLPLELLTPALKGFGVVASASFNRSSIKIDLSQEGDNAGSLGTASIGLPGLSKQVYNLTGYYEKDGFEARVSLRKRSDFIGEIGDFANNRKLRYVVGEEIVDAQIGYSFNTGQLKGLNLLFQVNNLTDAAYQTYTGTTDRPLEYVKWGRSYLLGANYKF